MNDVKRYTIDKNYSELIEEGGEWYRASDYDALLLERNNLEGSLQLAEEALYRKKISPAPEQIDALAFELHMMGVHVPPRDTAFFHAAVRKWLALSDPHGHGQQQWQDMSTFSSDHDDLVWLCKGDFVDGPRAPQIDDPDVYEWWCLAESPPLPRSAIKADKGAV
jgi:hypothetical protein